MSIRNRISAIGGAFREILANRITGLFILIAALFWAMVPIIESDALPWIDMASVVAALRAVLIGLPLAIAWSYAPAAVRKIREGDSGAITQWLVGVVFYFLSVALSSIYTLVWILRGRPDDMTVSSLLAFLLLSQAVGQSMLVTSPGATGSSIPRQNVKWLIAAGIVAALVVGFTVGTVTSKEAGLHISFATTRPSCPDTQPIWGNQSTMVYHTPASPYRAMVRPERCFSTVEEAIAEGYRAPG